MSGRGRRSSCRTGGFARAGHLCLRCGLFEDRALDHAHADVETEHQQRCAGEERDAPPPRLERRVRQQRREHHRRRREQESDRRAELHEPGPQAAPARVGVLGDHQCRPSPFAADRDTLHDSQRHEKDGRQHADLLVGGQDADREAGDAHHHHRDDQHRLASEPVAEVPEHQATERSREVTGGERPERGDRRDRRVRRREEQVAEDQGGHGAVEQEVVVLDGGTEQARQRDPPQLRVVAGRRALRGGCCARFLDRGRCGWLHSALQCSQGQVGTRRTRVLETLSTLTGADQGVPAQWEVPGRSRPKDPGRFRWPGPRWAGSTPPKSGGRSSCPRPPAACTPGRRRSPAPRQRPS